MNKRELQEAMEKSKPMINMNDEEFSYVQKPIGKAIYQNSAISKPIPNKTIGRPRKTEEQKVSPNDRIECKLCGKTYTRGNKKHHTQTKEHQIYEKVNDKLIKLMINDGNREHKRRVPG